MLRLRQMNDRIHSFRQFVRAKLSRQVLDTEPNPADSLSWLMANEAVDVVVPGKTCNQTTSDKTRSSGDQDSHSLVS